MIVHFSSAKSDWNTPTEVLRHLEEMGPVGFDPCSNKRSLVGARKAVMLPKDGLAIDWSGHGLVYVNPPYGRGVGKWVAKCEEADECVALLPARTDTQWFPWEADYLAFWQGRIKFFGAKHPAPFPSVLAYWGPQPIRFRRAFRSKCIIIKPGK